MSHDGAYGEERDVYHDDDNVDAEAEDMDVEDAASEGKNCKRHLSRRKIADTLLTFIISYVK